MMKAIEDSKMGVTHGQLNRAARSTAAWVEKLERVAALLSGLAIALMMLITTFGVVMRYFFRSPVPWAIEINEYLLVAAVFLAMAYTLQVEGHVSVDLLLAMVSPRTERLLGGAGSSLAIIFFTVALTWGGVELAARYRGVVSGTISQTPLFPSYVMIPVGSFLLLVQAIIRLIKSIQPRGSGKPETE